MAHEWKDFLVCYRPSRMMTPQYIVCLLKGHLMKGNERMKAGMATQDVSA